jgi:hypothetical protein
VAGQWKTSFGLLNLSQTESGLVSGVYQSPGGQGRLEGRIAAGRLDVTWSEPPTFAAPDHAGAGYFQISEDCTSLSGEFRRGNAGAFAEEWRAKRISSDNKTDDDDILPTDLAKRADQLQRIAARLRREGEKISKNRFEVAAVVAEIGKDPMVLRSWVGTETYLVPYRGLLRGAVGVLMDRRGNSLDRALLLAALLKAAGHEVRVARTTLHEDRAALLLTSPTPPRQPQAAGLTEAEAVTSLAEDTGLDAALVEKELAKVGTEQAGLTESLTSRVDSQMPTLLDLLAPVGRTAYDERKRAIAAVTDHWWVQRKDGERWVDLELSTTDGAALQTAEATFAPDAIPEELQHKATIRVTVESWDAGALRQAVVLDGTLRPADLPSVPVTLNHLPTNVIPPGTVDPDLDSKVLLGELTRETTWLPVLTTTDGNFVERTFNVSGETAPADASYLDALAKSLQTARQAGEKQAETFKAITDPLGGLLDPLGGKSATQLETPAINDKLTAEWLDIVVTVPGEAPVVHRRTIFDLLNEEVRAMQPVAEPIIDDDARRRRAFALAQSFDLVFLPAAPPPEYLTAILARDLAAVFDTVSSAFGALAAGQRISLPSDLPQTPLALYAFAAQRWSANADALFIDRTNIILLRRGLHEARDAAPTEFAQFDVMENSVGVNPAAPDNPFLLRMTQGLMDTATEAALLDSAGTANTSDLFERDRVAGKTWLLVTNAAAADRLPFAAGDRRRIAAAIAHGDVVLVRPEPVEVAGFSGAVWWRVDATTGATLGIGPDGVGQSMTEYAIQIGDFVARYAGMIFCLYKVDAAVRKGETRKVVASLACALASIVGLTAQYKKIHFIGRSDAPKNMIDGIKLVSTLISLAGGVAGL